MQGGPRIKHLEELPWIEVAKFQYADGHVAAVRERWFEHGPRFVAFYSEWEPRALSPIHGHTGDHSIYILRGGIFNDVQRCPAGSHIMLEWGDTFGPWEAGADGCTMYRVVTGPANVYLDRDHWKQFLAERGASEVPVTLPRFPLWYGTGASELLPNPTTDSA